MRGSLWKNGSGCGHRRVAVSAPLMDEAVWLGSGRDRMCESQSLGIAKNGRFRDNQARDLKGWLWPESA